MLGLLGSVEKGVGVVAPLLGGPVYTAAGPPGPAVTRPAVTGTGTGVSTIFEGGAETGGSKIWRRFHKSTTSATAWVTIDIRYIGVCRLSMRAGRVPVRPSTVQQQHTQTRDARRSPDVSKV